MCNRTGEILRWMELATPLGGPYIAHFRALAAELGIAIAATYLEAVTGPGGDAWPPRNTVALIDRHGAVAFNYAKVHTSVMEGLEALTTAGRRWRTAALDTGRGLVEVGALICFDREHSESARSLMLAGAEVLLAPNACGLSDATLARFAASAMENGVAVAMANHAAGWRCCNGQSAAYDHTGAELARGGEAEGVLLATVDIAALRAHRATAFGRSLRNVSARPELCTLPRHPAFAAAGALGRMNVPL